MKSRSIVLSLAFTAAVAACREQKDEEWTDGRENGRYRDTVAHGHPYRYYGGAWYPIFNNRIAPGAYAGASAAEISRPGFRPATRIPGGAGVERGGFGRSARGVSTGG